MTTKINCIIKIFSVILLIGSFTNYLSSQNQLNDAEFKNPSDDVKIHTWWHWLDGNITKEGITKDLEAMKKQGIVQATIFNVGWFFDRDFGVNRVTFNTTEWFEMFHWALKEANRLHISIGIHNCDGWSTSGGPWITPDKSMKQYVWTKTIINASQNATIILKKPIANYNFYNDVAVVAFKSDTPKNSFHREKPIVTFKDYKDTYLLFDGCFSSDLVIKEGDKITFNFKEDFTAEKIAIMPRKEFIWKNPADYISTYSISASNDGEHYEQIKKFTLNGLNKLASVSFEKTTAKYFQLTLLETNKLNHWLALSIAECELLPENEKPLYANEIEYLPEKSINVKAADNNNFNSRITQCAKINKEVIDLTSKMNNDGTLNWRPDAGNWAIIRFGYTTTASINVPATEAGRGLECDKMDTTALNVHFNNFPKKLIENAGELTGNTFKFMLIDSWEAEFQNWTAGMLNEFEKRRGYSLIKYIPVLCGESTGKSEVDEGVLYDLRKTIAELIEENYYKHFGDLLHRYNLEYHAEVIYGETNTPPVDILKTTQYVDLPMYEFWSKPNDNQDVKYNLTKIELNMPACAVTGYDKPILGAEAYTSFTHYSETPANLKPFGDNAYCSGINQMILASYVHQPNDKKSGLTLGRWGSLFNRNNSYWPHISEWFKYQSRIQYVLQQGTVFQDVLYYIGDQLPQYLSYNKSNRLPFGYMFNTCNFDILKNRIKVVDDKLVLNGKVQYSILSLPPNDCMNFETLKRIEELVNDGITLYAPKPQRMLSLYDINNNSKQFNRLVNNIWGKIDGKTVFLNHYGKGKVYWGMPLSEVLETEKILPDLQTNENDSTSLLYIHKKIGNNDVYFVMNQLDSTLCKEIRFRVTGKTPEIWDPELATITKPAIFHINENYTSLPVKLGPYKSFLFVFKDEKPEHFIQNINQYGKQIFPVAESSNLTDVPNIVIENNKFTVISPIVEGKFALMDNNKKIYTLHSGKEKEFVLNDFAGRIIFKPDYSGTIQPIEIDTLQWLTEYENDDVKYFSGKAIYEISFTLPVNRITKYDYVFLDLGEFESIACVKLNDIDLGILWKQGKYLPVKAILKTNNKLEITVTNTYRNRFIGDYIQFGEIKTLWTSAPVFEFLNENSSLMPSGLKGPIKIRAMNKQIIK